MEKIKKILYLADLFFIGVAFLFFLELQYKYTYGLTNYSYLNLLIIHYKAFILISISWFFLSDYTKLYSVKRINSLRVILKMIFFQSFIFSLLVFTISGIKEEDLLSNKFIVIYSLVVSIYLFISRILLFFQTKNYHINGKNIKNVIVIGDNKNTEKLENILLDKNQFGLKIVKHFVDVQSKEIIEFAINNNIKKIFISQSGGQNIEVENDILFFCDTNHISISYIPYTMDNNLVDLELDYIDTLPIFKLKKYPLDITKNRILKNSIDFIFSLLACIFLFSWLFPLIGILIKIDSKGPVFFIQKRRGMNGGKFDCYKFRTMTNDGTNSIDATVVNDKRITKFGQFLRKTSLDELPQFLNVLKGDMSIVGPRPHMKTHDDYCRQITRNYDVRHNVKPGITGLAQVKGFRGAINSDRDFENRVRTDIFYVRNWSVLLDLQIIYQTVELIFKGDENAI